MNAKKNMEPLFRWPLSLVTVSLCVLAPMIKVFGSDDPHIKFKQTATEKVLPGARLLTGAPSSLSSAASGNTLALASLPSGAVYIYELRDRRWILRATLSPKGANGGFGKSVAISDDTVVVGANAAGGNDQGAVYVYVRRSEKWVQRAVLTAHDHHAGDRFGTSVAISQGTILVGAPLKDRYSHLLPTREQGAVYVFNESNGAWLEQAKLEPGERSASAAFGSALALDGNTAAIGADGAQVGDSNQQGALFVFTRTEGKWAQQAKIADALGAAGDRFGSSVAIRGDLMAIGAAHQRSFSGEVLLFARHNGSWKLIKTLSDRSNPSTAELFGYSLCMSKDQLVVGAPGWSDGKQEGLGAVYVFHINSGIDLDAIPVLIPAPALRQGFGESVAVMSEGTVSATAHYWDGLARQSDDFGGVYAYAMDRRP